MSKNFFDCGLRILDCGFKIRNRQSEFRNLNHHCRSLDGLSYNNEVNQRDMKLHPFSVGLQLTDCGLRIFDCGFKSEIAIPNSEILIDFLQKGGVPAAPSGTATLLRLSPSH